MRDAVGPLLPGAVAAYGGVLVGLDHLGDDPDLLAKAVQDADAEVVVTSGASSVGRADFLPVVLQALRAEVLVPSVAVRYAALARWSSIGVPSARITAAASRTTSALQARPSSAASVASARMGVAATPPRPMRALATTPSRRSSAREQRRG